MILNVWSIDINWSCQFLLNGCFIVHASKSENRHGIPISVYLTIWNFTIFFIFWNNFKAWLIKLIVTGTIFPGKSIKLDFSNFAVNFSHYDTYFRCCLICVYWLTPDKILHVPSVPANPKPSSDGWYFVLFLVKLVDK